MKSIEAIAKKNAYNKAYRIAHIEEIKANRKVYNLTHREKNLAYQKIYRAAHREEKTVQNKSYYACYKTKILAYDIKRKYGLSGDDFNRLIDNQNGACAICERTDWNGKKPGVDHDHATGKIRGILCHNCNAALGHIKDNQKTAKAIFAYLCKHQGIQP